MAKYPKSKVGGYDFPVTVIKVDYATNPRTYYGTPEKQLALRLNIKKNGILEPLRVRPLKNDPDGYEYELTHGFCRMKEVLTLITEGEPILTIPATITTGDDKQILIEHLTYNSGKPLQDFEEAKIYKTLANYGWTIKKIAEECCVKYEHVQGLLAYEKNASTDVKDAVENGEMSITAAKILSGSLDTGEEQNQALNELKEQAQVIGKKIQVDQVKKLVTVEKDWNDEINHLVSCSIEEITNDAITMTPEMVKHFQKLLREVGYDIKKK